MKRVDILIWKSFVDNLGGSVSSIDMCRELGLSRRQLLTRITKLHYPHVTKYSDDGGRQTYFSLDCDMEEAQICTIQLLSKYYGCTKADIVSLLRTIPSDHSVTLDEVDLGDKGFTTKDLINIMSMMPCIEITKTWSKNRYRRVLDV